MKKPDILKGPWKLNGSTVTANGDWQLAVACPPFREAPKPTPDALAVTKEDAKQLAVAIAAVPDLLEALEEMLSEAGQAGIDTMPGDDFAGFLIACENAKSALTKAGYTF
jgi:hypothetical protein